MNNLEFLTQIANGFNPITGEAFDENDILRKPEISKRLLDLVQTLQDDEKATKKDLQDNFVYDAQIEKLIECSEVAKLSKFATTIAWAIKQNTGRGVWHRSSIQSKIEKFLVLQGKIERIYNPELHKNRYFATEKGLEFGITNELEPEKDEFSRHFLNFNEYVQKYIISNLPEILKIPSSEPKNYQYSTSQNKFYKPSYRLDSLNNSNEISDSELEELNDLADNDDFDDLEELNSLTDDELDTLFNSKNK